MDDQLQSELHLQGQLLQAILQSNGYVSYPYNDVDGKWVARRDQLIIDTRIPLTPEQADYLDRLVEQEC